MGEGCPEVTGRFRWDETTIGSVLRCDALEPYATHAFTTRSVAFRDGRDYDRLAALFSLSSAALITVKQVHASDVLIVRTGENAAEALEADVVVAADSARVACVRVADCVPVLLADRGRRAVAAVHAGWRGTLAGAAGAAVRALAGLGVPPDDLLAAIGPSIGPCCYQVDSPVRDRFVAAGADVARWFLPDSGVKWKLDLWKANADQLVMAGVDPANIHVAGLCTFDHASAFFSFRREGPGTGRLVAAVRTTQAPLA